MLETLFPFPIIQVDRDNEEKKQRLALPSDEKSGYDIVYAEAEYPYHDFIGIEDAWIPSDEKSFEEAKEGIFNVCMVKFVNIPQLLVPWSKKKFKDKLKAFIDKLHKEDENEPEVVALQITPDQLKSLLTKIEEDAKGKKDE